jgi:hypothetical protein
LFQYVLSCRVLRLKFTGERILTRGRRWSAYEEKKLAEFVKAGVTAPEIAKRLGRSIVGVHDKVWHLGLEDDEGVGVASSSSLSSLSSLSVNIRNSDAEESSVAKSVESSDAEKSSSESSSPSLVPPETLSCPDEALKKLAAAVVALERPNLSRNEIQRLKCIILGAEKYQGLFAKVAEYRKLEERMAKLETKYFEMAKNRTTTQNDAHP